MRKCPELLRSLLVYAGSSLDAETMLGLFHFGFPREDEQEQATVLWLKEYVQARSTEKEGVFSLLNLAWHYTLYEVLIRCIIRQASTCFFAPYPGDDLTGKVRADLGDIIQFLTWLRIVPPLGMTKKINIYFHSDSASVA